MDTLKSQVLALFDITDLSYNRIAEQLSTNSYQVTKIVGRYRTKTEISNRNKAIELKRYAENKDLSEHIEGVCKDKDGYYTIAKPEWWSCDINSKRVYYHHYVFCRAVGLFRVPEGFVVHHIDGNKTNNALINLALLTHKAHKRLHDRENRLKQ